MIEGQLNGINEPVVSVTVRGPAGQIELDAVIDTGFSDSLTLPDDVLAELGVFPIDRAQIRLADGSITFAKLYQARIRWLDDWKRVLIQAANTTPLVGARLLQGCSLLIEYRNEGMVRIEPLEE